MLFFEQQHKLAGQQPLLPHDFVPEPQAHFPPTQEIFEPVQHTPKLPPQFAPNFWQASAVEAKIPPPITSPAIRRNACLRDDSLANVRATSSMK